MHILLKIKKFECCCSCMHMMMWLNIKYYNFIHCFKCFVMHSLCFFNYDNNLNSYFVTPELNIIKPNIRDNNNFNVNILNNRKQVIIQINLIFVEEND